MPYLWQVAAGDAGKVMVLVVVADVERDEVEGAVVRVRLVALREDVVL